MKIIDEIMCFKIGESPLMSIFSFPVIPVWPRLEQRSFSLKLLKQKFKDSSASIFQWWHFKKKSKRQLMYKLFPNVAFEEQVYLFGYACQ